VGDCAVGPQAIWVGHRVKYGEDVIVNNPPVTQEGATSLLPVLMRYLLIVNLSTAGLMYFLPSFLRTQH
jgi:hypothetical protein